MPHHQRHLLVCQRVRFRRDEDRPRVVLVQVGAADAVEADLELHGSGSGCRFGHVGDLDLVRSVIHSCFHEPVLCDRRHTGKSCSALQFCGPRRDRRKGAIHSHFCAQMSVWARRGHATRCNSCQVGTVGCVLAHMTQILEPTDTVTPQQRVDAWLADFEAALGGARHRARGGQVRHRQLLARPGRVHLEHQDRRGSRRDCRHAAARGWPGTDPSGFRTREAPTAGRRRDVGVHRVRDGRRPRRRASAA